MCPKNPHITHNKPHCKEAVQGHLEVIYYSIESVNKMLTLLVMTRPIYIDLQRNLSKLPPKTKEH